jgi:hypothetical protein
MPGILKSVFNYGVAQFLHWRYRRIKRMMDEPLLMQQQLLAKLSSNLQTTAYGKKYYLRSVRNYTQYAAQMPVVEYEDLRPYILRMMAGEKDLLVNGFVRWYSKSSGTTSDKSKFIPVPRENLYGCHIRGSWDTVTLLYHHDPEIRLFSGKSLVMGGSVQTTSSMDPRARTGDISAIMIHHMPSVGKPFYAPDTSIAMVSDWEEKIRRTADYLLKERDLVMFGGVPTWNLVLFRRLLEQTGAEHLIQLFPNLRAYVHGGVGFEPYRDEFKRLIPADNFHYMEVYNASEGFFAVSDMPNTNDMMLLVDNGVFYEFIELADYQNGIYNRAVPLEGVKLKVNYVMLVSTYSGLCRYVPGDTVQFTSTNPYRIRISGRTQQFVNAFGEEVIVANTDLALAMTCQRLGLIAREYTVAPVYLSSTHQGKHEWLIEFELPPTDIHAFELELDANLQGLNSDYEAKRSKSLALDCLSVASVNKNTFVSWLKSKGKEGGQYKVPRLSNNRVIIEDLKSFLDKSNYGFNG